MGEMVEGPPTAVMMAANALAEKAEADIFLFRAPIGRDTANELRHEIVRISHRRKNAVLLLDTLGGDPDAAFLIARALKLKYAKFTVAVFDMCKSAGTLIVLGADEVVISDFGELGPLDIQLGKDDELYKRSSGLDLNEAIRYLKDLSWELFLQNFIRLKRGSSITTKTAAEIAQSLAMGVVQPVANQIDPLRLGEVQRALRIVRDYGKLLNPGLTPECMDRLVTGYPSHGFVIDFHHAREIFPNVRSPRSDEFDVYNALIEAGTLGASDVIDLISSPLSTQLHHDRTPQTSHVGTNGSPSPADGTRGAH